jgi:putative nucleotidyltransferase with HDIG domain
MSLGKRRPRPTPRVQLRPSQSIDIRQARQRSRWTRLGLIAAAVVATAAIVHGNGPPFTFRLGQRLSRPILVSVEEFRRRDPIKTNAERRSRAEAVDPLLTNDPRPIEELSEQLVDLVTAVGRVNRPELLDETLSTRWDLDEATFLDIRAAADSPERLDELKRRIGQAFGPLIARGVLGPEALPPGELSRPKPTLRVRLKDRPVDAAVVVTRDQILPERIKKPDGPVASAFAEAFLGTGPKLGQRLFTLVEEKLTSNPTLTFEDRLTQQEREAVKNAVAEEFRDYHRGELLVDQGEQITEDQLSVLKLEHDALIAQLSVPDRLRRAASVLVLVAAVASLIGYYLQRHEPRLVTSPRRIAALCGLFVLTMGVARLLAVQPWDAELIPVALTAMILAIAYNPQTALMVAFGLSVLTTLALGMGIGHFLVLIGGTAAAALPLREVRTRTKPIQVGAYAACAFFVLTWASGMFQNQAIEVVALDASWRAVWGLMAGFFLGGSLPFVEKTFGIVTGISLLELGDITHPLLQELVRRAPGTHNHSVTVGTIAEGAAERIGANALLVRIGAYFHDIGKMVKPHYFVENQAGAANRHANLAPAMSTLIIIGHVKDGVELARQHHLPQPIIDLIEQHHGTTLVEYFYREATRRCHDDPDAATVQESAFRYPGPKPQSKEAGILMISDAVESASRTLTEPTPARIDSLVGELIQKRLDDGQFDECGLTLREIAEIRESLIKSLIGIYHGRVKYPEQRTA